MLREYERMHPTMLDYFKYREATYSGRGLHKYKHNLLTYWRWLQDRNLDPLKVKADDMAEYQRHIADRHRTPKGQRLSPSSQVKRLTAVRAYYRFLERSGVLLVDVSKGLRLPRIPKGVTKRDYLSLQEATALLQTQARRTEATRKTKLKWAIELRNLAFFSLAIATGRRRNGLFELKVDDLDFKRDEIRVSKEKGKTGRVLPVARWAMMVAREYIELARPRFLSARNSDYLFVSKRNGTLSHQVNSALTEVHRQTVEENPDLAELAGKRLTPHGLRVTFAKLLFNGGCNLRSVNELMLHDRLSTTAHYTPLKLEELRRTLPAGAPEGLTMLMKEAIREYLEARRVQNASPKTLVLLGRRLGYLSRFLLRRRVKRATEVNPGDLTGYAAQLARRGASHETRCAYLSAVCVFFRWLAERGRILVNPARHLVIPEEDEAPLPAPPLTEEEVSRILDHLPRRSVVDLRNRLHLELLYGCGLRITESLELRVSDIDMANRSVRIRGKFGKIRVLPIMRGALGALKDYMALRRSLLRGPDSGVLLLGKTTGRPLTPPLLYQVLRNLRRRLGLKRRLNPHLFRHSIAVHLLQRGADIRHVQEFLGHASIDTTKVYLRMVPGRLKEDYDKAMPVIAVKT